MHSRSPGRPSAAWSSRAHDSPRPAPPGVPALVLVGLYGVGAVFAYVGALAAVAGVLSWRLDPAASRTVRSLASMLPVGTAIAIGLAVAFASTRRFSTDLTTVLGDV